MPNASVLEDILQAVKTGITGLSLSGLSSSSVIVCKTSLIRKKEFDTGSLPAVTVAPIGSEQINTAAGSNVRDDVVYGIVISIVGSDEQDQGTSRDTWFGWRQSIRRKFHNKLDAFSSITAAAIINSTVTPGPIVDKDSWLDNSLFVSHLLIQVTSRESRT